MKSTTKNEPKKIERLTVESSIRAGAFRQPAARFETSPPKGVSGLPPEPDPTAEGI